VYLVGLALGDQHLSAAPNRGAVTSRVDRERVVAFHRGLAVTAEIGMFFGAVPVILATFAVIDGVPRSVEVLNIVFFAVLVSAARQGTTVQLLASRVLPARRPKMRARTHSVAGARERSWSYTRRRNNHDQHRRPAHG
jgi:NhaP-type Na+/H+ and K+/H+ antiporter